MKQIIFILILLFQYCYIKSLNNNEDTTKIDQTDFINKHEMELLLSINLIANPHYFPQYGLDVNYKDPFGNKFNFNKNINETKYIPGELSDVGKRQIINIANNIQKDFTTYKNFNSIKKEEILTISTRLKRSIDTSIILNENLMRINKINFKNQHVKKFIMEYLNVQIPEYNLKNNTLYDGINYLDLILHNPIFPQKKSENFTINDIVTFFIPSEYEKTILPINYQLQKCPKLVTQYETFINSKEVLNTLNTVFKDIFNNFNLILNKNKSRKFLLTNNKIHTNYLNFEEHTLNHTIEANLILLDYFVTYETLKYTKSQIIHFSPNEHYWKNYFKLNLKATLVDFKNYDSYFIKNFSDNFLKVYLNGLFKFFSRLIFSKLDNENIIKDYASTLKIVNLIMHEYNLAGLIKAIFLNKEFIMIDNFNLPKINFGSKLTINIIKIIGKNGPNLENISNNIFVKISHDEDVLVTFKMSEFLERMEYFIINNYDFFNNLC